MKKKVTKILFVGNGPNSNRGCEAIIRGAMELLQKTFGNIECTNIYNVVNSNELYKSDLENSICHKAMHIGYKNIVDRIIKAASLRYAPRLWEKLSLQQILQDIRKSDLVLSLGGDNYSLDYGLPRRFIQLGKLVKRQGKPFVILGGSVGPFDNAGPYGKTILRHLREEVDQIHVREDRSYNYLIAHGCRNVVRVADPAFLMTPEKPEGFELKESVLASAIGLNISPLIMKKIKTNGRDPVWWIRQLALQLRDETEHPVVLIYHVTSPHTNDYELLSNVKQSLGADSENIYLLKGGMSSPEIKWVISKLSCFIGARTHATIASLSSCVPTISIAYSVKAWGINEDLFGHANYVVSAEDATINKLIQLTTIAIQEHAVIKATLNSKMKEVKAKALEAGNQLVTIISPSYL